MRGSGTRTVIFCFVSWVLGQLVVIDHFCQASDQQSTTIPATDPRHITNEQPRLARITALHHFQVDIRYPCLVTIRDSFRQMNSHHPPHRLLLKQVQVQEAPPVSAQAELWFRRPWPERVARHAAEHAAARLAAEHAAADLAARHAAKLAGHAAGRAAGNAAGHAANLAAGRAAGHAAEHAGHAEGAAEWQPGWLDRTVDCSWQLSAIHLCHIRALARGPVLRASVLPRSSNLA